MGPKKLECLSLVSLSNLVQDNNIPYLALLNFTKNVKSCEYGPLGLGRFVEQKLALSSNFNCDQIHNCHGYDFGHTLLCYLSQT
jgi:hypothetical protein